ncbi:MAG: energy transducer TonB [Bacteroidota bacterium]|jgi:protein TonB
MKKWIVLFFSLITLSVTAQQLPEHSTNRDDTFIVVDQMPEYPGGNEALQEYISLNLKYPALKEVSGKVFVSFVVDKKGKVTDVKVKNDVDAALAKEAVRLVKSMPLWTPGKLEGKPVNVQLNLPIYFKAN